MYRDPLFTIRVNDPDTSLGGCGTLLFFVVFSLLHSTSQRNRQTYAYAARLAHPWHEQGIDALTTEHNAIEGALAYHKEHQPGYTCADLSAFVASVMCECLHDAQQRRPLSNLLLVTSLSMSGFLRACLGMQWKAKFDRL